MSTSHALVELPDEITNSLDNKKCAVDAFIDPKKAFDTVDHQLLCRETRARKEQSVECHKGLHLALNYIFCMYINDMCNASKFIRFIVFADDINIFCSANNVKQLDCIICK